MIIKEALTRIKISSPTPKLDLELLLAKVLEKNREFLHAYPEYQLNPEQLEHFGFLCERRNSGEPIAYILGKRDFWSLEFAVNDKVLIPRPETELLVEIILDKVKNDSIDLADLGTGSGAIAVSLAKERPSWRVVATDLSADALQVASHNAMEHMINNIEFYCGDWCDALPQRKFDVIVSNPPYIRENDPHLEQGDLLFEPRPALESGDGMDAIKKIVFEAKNKLKPGGLLVIEHGYDQGKEAADLLREEGYKNVATHKDLANLDRATLGFI